MWNLAGNAATLGFVAFAFSLLSLTPVAADCIERKTKTCKGGERLSRKQCIFDTCYLTCCFTPSEPYATGGQNKGFESPARSESV
jgi:hypothetical protein